MQDPTPQDDSQPGIDEAREALRRLGYLDRRMERYLLQDAFRPEAPGRTVLWLMVKVVLLGATPAALATALLLMAMNGYFDEATPASAAWDLIPLFAHLLIPAAVVVGGAFLVLAAVLVVLLRLLHRRRIETLTFALAAVAAVVVTSWLAWHGRGLWPFLPRPIAALGLLALPTLAYGILRLAHDGLLGLAIRLTDQAPERPWQWGRTLAAGLVLAAFLLGLPAFLAVQHEAALPPNLPLASRGGKVLLIGVDGVRRPELEFLLGRGRLPNLASRLAQGALIAPYRRPAVSPNVLWISVATGATAARHGMGSIDSYRPIFLQRPLLQGSWLRPYWRWLAAWGLAEYRAVLARERRVPTLWELLERGGLPTAVVNWWGTFPVEPAVGHHLAHGAFQLLGDPRAKTDAILAPPTWHAALEALRQGAALPADLTQGLAALGPSRTGAVVEDALLPDAFYRAALRDALDRAPETRLAAVYLPGLDIAAVGHDANRAAGRSQGAEGEKALGSTAFAEVVAWQLSAVDELLAELGPRFETVILVFDGGRREPSEGFLLISLPTPCGGPLLSNPLVPDPLLPEHAAAAVARALGLPQSDELPLPPAACGWPDAPLRVETYGPRQGSRPEVDSEEYLHSLKSLGYL